MDERRKKERKRSGTGRVLREEMALHRSENY